MTRPGRSRYSERGASDGPTLFGWFLILGVVVLIVQGIGDLLGFGGDEEGRQEANRQSLVDERQDARQERRKRLAQEQAREARLAAERARKRQAARVQKAEAAPIVSAAGECDPNYGGCLDPTASDYDCEGGEGDGPAYTGQVEILGTDVHGLDSDNDGVACEPTS